MALELSNSNLYQNGRIIQVEADEQLLLRETLVPKEELTDNFEYFKDEDEIMLFAYSFYKDSVANANLYWWLIADRNDVMNPLANTFIVDGELKQIEGENIVIPNILKQQTQF